jgi:hypothetical protein
MKKVTIIFCLATIFASCTKTDFSGTPGIGKTSLIGKWEKIRFQTYDHYQNYQTGKGNILQLNSDKTYTRLLNFQQVVAGSYYTLAKGASSANKTFDAIYFSEYSEASTISQKADTLVIGNAPNDAKGNIIMDGGFTVYLKQK